MRKDQQTITEASLEKCLASIALVEASVGSMVLYDPLKQYTPKEREPYDALSDRFSRSIEISLKFFRSYEIYLFGESSATTRDLLNRMAKVELISSVKLWMEMRDVRNRIVHDYLPEEIQAIYDQIMGSYAAELKKLKTVLKNLQFD